MNTTAPASRRLGKHQRALLHFSELYPGPHTMTTRRSDPAHRALAALTRRGLVATILIGSSVMFERAQGVAF